MRFTDSIVAFCEDIATLPLQGKARDDIRPGLRIIGYRRRVVIVFLALGEVVVIVGSLKAGATTRRFWPNRKRLSQSPETGEKHATR